MFTTAMIALYLVLRFVVGTSIEVRGLPLYQFAPIAALIGGGIPLLFDLLTDFCRGEFGVDLLAGISIVTSAILGEYLAGAWWS